jgi:hypothetical protein
MSSVGVSACWEYWNLFLLGFAEVLVCWDLLESFYAGSCWSPCLLGTAGALVCEKILESLFVMSCWSP